MPLASSSKSTAAKNGERSPFAIARFWSLSRYGASKGSWNRKALSKNADGVGHRVHRDPEGGVVALGLDPDLDDVRGVAAVRRVLRIRVPPQQSVVRPAPLCAATLVVVDAALVDVLAVPIGAGHADPDRIG